MSNLPRRLALYIPAIAVAALLAGAPMLVLQMRTAAPAASYVDHISVAAAKTPAVLGFEALGQHPGPRSAARRHLLVDRRNGRWVLGNRTLERRVLIRTNRLRSAYLQRWRLRPGDRFSAGDREIAVIAADTSHLVLRDTASGRSVTWKGGTLTPAGEPVYRVCRGWWSRTVLKVRWLLRDFGPEDRSELPLFSIGGGVNCSARWRLESLPPEAVRVVWHDGSFWLAPGEQRRDVLMRGTGTGSPADFTDLVTPVDGPEGRIEYIILGQTRYRLATTPKAFTLVPSANIDLWFEKTPQGAIARKSWIGDGAGLLAWIESQKIRALPGLAAALLAVAVLFLYWRRRRQLGVVWFGQTVGAFAPALLGSWLTLLLHGGGGHPDALLPAAMVWLSWTWATLMMLSTGRLRGIAGWLWLSAVFLAGVGLVVLLQLGAGAENTRWLSFARKQATLLALFGWTVSALTAVPDRLWQRLWPRLFSTEGVFAGIAALLVLAMAAQLAFGSEQGIGGLQPVEMTKTLYVILLAFVGMHLTEVRRRESRAYQRAPMLFLLPFLRFIAIFLVVVLSAVAGVHDFSPIIIIGLVGLAWAWKLGGSQGEHTGAGAWLLLRPAVVAVLLVVVGSGFWAWHNADRLPWDMPQRDRIQVWAQPELHPHSGAQVLNAMDRVGEGSWTGATAWFGPNGRVMRVPAVQDDFITAFFLYRFGGLAGLAWFGFQALYLTALFVLARRVEMATASGDFREQAAGMVLGYTLFGLAWMQIAHWTIAWSNTLGLLPVMGQPMTWMSAGNSHLLGVALASLGIALVTAWILQTDQTA